MKQRVGLGDPARDPTCIRWPLSIVTRLVRFLRTVFEPTDWVAIFLKSYERSRVAQRVGPVSWIQSERFQRWLGR